MSTGTMSTPGIMSAKRLQQIMAPPYVSISRTGRNEAINSSVNVAATTKLQSSRRPEKLPQSEPILSGGTVFDSQSFGIGETMDRGKAREMSSSPRAHPLMDASEQRVYESQRMQVFEDLKGLVPRLELVDKSNMSPRQRKAAERGELARVGDLDDVDGDSLAGDEEPAAAAPEVAKRAQSPAKAHHHPHAPVHPPTGDMSPAARGKAVAPVSQTSPRGQLSPRAPHEPSPHAKQQMMGSASFHSPQRFKDAGSVPAPPVGHYRPRHEATEHAITHGYIGKPPQQNLTPRAEPVERQVKVKPSVQTARARLEQKARGISPDRASNNHDMDDLEPTKKQKAPAPAPTIDSTWAFKSKIEQCSSYYAYSAAPDKWYWPRNDTASSTFVGPKGNVRLSKHTPRKPLSKEIEVPDAYYNVVEAGKNDRSPVNMKRQVERAPLAISHLNDTPFYDVDRSHTLTKPSMTQVDFTKTSPRRDQKVAGHGTVSAEEAPMPGASSLTAKRTAQITMDRSKAREDQLLRHINDLSYNVEETLSSPRTRHANIRNDKTGHQPLWQPSITDNCSYDPQLNPVRPTILRNVDFDKGTARQPERTNLHDLTYDANESLTTKRLQGNPMIATHVARDKREKLLSPRKVHSELPGPGIDLNVVKTDRTGVAIDFAKQVTKDKLFSAKNIPSEDFKQNYPRAPPPGSYDANHDAAGEGLK